MRNRTGSRMRDSVTRDFVDVRMDFVVIWIIVKCRVVLPDRSATSVAPSSGAAQSPLSPCLLSLSLFLSRGAPLSRHFKINLSFALARLRRRLSIPFNLACKCRLNIFWHPTKISPRRPLPVTISLSGRIRGREGVGTKPQLRSRRRVRGMYFCVSTRKRR